MKTTEQIAAENARIERAAAAMMRMIARAQAQDEPKPQPAEARKIPAATKEVA